MTWLFRQVSTLLKSEISSRWNLYKKIKTYSSLCTEKIPFLHCNVCKTDSVTAKYSFYGVSFIQWIVVNSRLSKLEPLRNKIISYIKHHQRQDYAFKLFDYLQFWQVVWLQQNVNNWSKLLKNLLKSKKEYSMPTSNDQTSTRWFKTA